jgi:hypothetical protein
MILTSTILTLRDITLLQRGILYHPTIGERDGVKVSNPTSGFELWLSGEADYVVSKKNMGESERHKPLLQVMKHVRFSAPLVSPSGSRAVLFLLYFFLKCVYLELEAWRRSVARHPRLQVIAYS